MKSFHITTGLVLLSYTLLMLSCKKLPPTPAEKSVAATAPAQESVSAGEKLSLSIYYAGHPGSSREKDFAEFLAKHFTKVQTGDLAAFNGSQSNGFDVTILDYDGDGFKSPKPGIPNTFDRPVVTMGVTGAFLCGSLNLKTDYL